MSSLEELLKPNQIYAEYGIKTRCLAYMRSQTKDEGALIGPMWIQQGNIVFYKRKWIVEWMTKYQGFVPPVQTQQTQQTKQKTSNVHKFQNKTT